MTVHLKPEHRQARQKMEPKGSITSPGPGRDFASAAELCADIKAITQRQHRELQSCLAKWSDRVQVLSLTVSPPGTPAPLLPTSPGLPLNSCWSKPEVIAEVLEPEVDEKEVDVPGVLNGDQGDAMTLTTTGNSGKSIKSRRSLLTCETESVAYNPATLVSTGSRKALKLKSEWQKLVQRHIFDIKFRRKPMHAMDYLTNFARREAKYHESRLTQIITSRSFEVVSIFWVACSALITGYQVQYLSSRALDNAGKGEPHDSSVPVGFLVAHVIFGIIFTVEITLRWVADGLLGYFRTPEWGWNLFDVFVLVVSIIEIGFELGSQRKSMFVSIALTRLLRVIRFVRIFRVVRVFRFFRELRLMLYAILGSVKSLVWVTKVFLLLFYVFGIGMTSGVYERLERDDLWQDQSQVYVQLRRHFGTMPRSMMSLYMGMSNGRDWGELYDPLEELSWIYQTMFIVYITFSIFAVVNVVTSIFVETALRTSERDREFQIQEELRSKEDYLRSIYKLFKEIDTNDSGTITINEFEEKLEDERALVYLKCLKLDCTEARTLFALLDVDRSGSVEIEEFLLGCEKLKGEARSLDVAVIQYELRHLSHAFFNHVEQLEQQRLPPMAAEVAAAKPDHWRSQTTPIIQRGDMNIFRGVEPKCDPPVVSELPSS
mmetsp:Transcript_62119/g.110841  ORF Transcript_62119/g.110841 Transcript_62119/m.110841 type:complete len:659 (+) Transcript_62119:84-2060(+)